MKQELLTNNESKVLYDYLRIAMSKLTESSDAKGLMEESTRKTVYVIGKAMKDLQENILERTLYPEVDTSLNVNNGELDTYIEFLTKSSMQFKVVNAANGKTDLLKEAVCDSYKIKDLSELIRIIDRQLSVW